MYQWAQGPILVLCAVADSVRVHRCPQNQSDGAECRPAPVRAVVALRAVGGCLIAGLLAGIALCESGRASAQDLVPRAYVIVPTGGNAIDVGYAHLSGGLQFDGAVPITGAQSDSSVLALGYYHSFSFLGRTANVSVGVPYGIGNFEGTVAEVPRSTHRSGFLDSVYRLSVNLIGGPAMEPREFARWRQDVLLGMSLKIVAPTGQYDPTLLVNWGGNRWAFKPEIGYSQRFGRWLVDAYGAVWFFTRNPEYFSHNQYFPGTRWQSESPVSAFEAHLSYDAGRRLWISLDANYWSGGETTVNGVPNTGSYQRSSRVGVTASVPVSAHQSFKLSYSDGAYIRYGGNYRTISLTWQYGWLSTTPGAH